MRLLNTKTLELEEHYEDIPKYAILSHRWGPDEVTFNDFSNERVTGRTGWPKVLSCCRMATSRGISHVWIDTCCIDKSSSAELTESINSMYAYYRNAEECYAFLGDVDDVPPQPINRSTQNQTVKELSDSVWFTRGWTLQELIAPSEVIFFNSKWQKLGTKNNLCWELQKITRISTRLLKGEAALTDFSLAQRMAWAANRTTTRPEDEAYCLLGIFQVNMPMLYGEGRNAFRRLQEEIIKQSDDQTLFAWHDDRDVKPVLAPSAACFKDLHNLKCIYATNDARFGHTLSNSGLNIKLMLIPWAMDIYVAPLSCGQALSRDQSTVEQSVRGYSRMGIFLRRTKYEDHLVRVSVMFDDGYNDFVMLDSDVVAKKRNSFKIKDRQIFVRQLLVETSDELHHSFTFSFHHPQMFRTGFRPTRRLEVLNESFTCEDVPSDPHYGLIQEKYRHYESAVFDVTGLSPGLRKHYLRLGYDLDFVPVCLITTESEDNDGDDASMLAKMELNGMSTTTDSVASLPWLLSKIDAGQSVDTLLAFKAKSGALTTVNCAKLSLRINFEVKDVLRPESEYRPPMKMWHVTFEPFTGIPNTPLTTPLMPPGSLAPSRLRGPSSATPPSRPKSKKRWVRFFTFGVTKREHKIIGLVSGNNSDDDISYQNHSSAITYAPELSSRSPYDVVISKRYSILTPAPDMTTPAAHYEPLPTRHIYEGSSMEPIYESSLAGSIHEGSPVVSIYAMPYHRPLIYEMDATSTSPRLRPKHDSRLPELKVVHGMSHAHQSVESRINDFSEIEPLDLYYLMHARG